MKQNAIWNGTVDYAVVNVSGCSLVGGLIGESGGTISDCYAAGNIFAEGDVGGLIGFFGNGAIINCFATGNVSGDEENIDVGGLVGDNFYDSEGTITNSYYNCDTVKKNLGRNPIYYGEQKTTVQMRNKNTYIGWDFEIIWSIDDKFNNGMPYLRWQRSSAK
jgi:hypothetical protein